MTAAISGRPGLAGPTTTTPPRLPGSVRRTTNLDLLPQPDGTLVLAGRARDLVTQRDGRTRASATGLLRLRVDHERRVAEVGAHPGGDALAALVGRSVSAGFRTAVYRALPQGYDDGSPVHLLLDDVPGAMVISGFARRRAAKAAGVPPPPPAASRRLDVCIGWASDSDAARRLARGGASPPHWNPPAPDLAAADPIGTHSQPDLPVHAMRRARRLDVRPDGPDTLVADVNFRDTFADVDGTVRVLHEYSVRLQATAGRVSAIDVTAHVLPHLECPLGAASAQRIVGRSLSVLRDFVSLDLFGPTTCTHLNDLLRGLSDLPALAGPVTALAGPLPSSSTSL
ncbi:MAG: DUF2889 domain-containing protein [Tetrasphaera sp.]